MSRTFIVLYADGSIARNGGGPEILSEQNAIHRTELAPSTASLFELVERKIETKKVIV